jgi:hypothetical protein
VGQLFQKISEVIVKPLVLLKGVRPENNGKFREKKIFLKSPIPSDHVLEGIDYAVHRATTRG